MARIIRPSLRDPSQYVGLDWIFEYTNHDGDLTTWNCGQAALATLLTHHRAMDPVEAADNMAWLEANHPPDQLAGWFGTGRKRVERALRAFHIEPITLLGEDEIRAELAKKNPVMVMVGCPSYRLASICPAATGWSRSATKATGCT
jgi:hypothetical protein